jgi:hypothetical protein
MALRRTTQPHTAEAQLFVLPVPSDAMRADTKKSFATATEETVMDQSLSGRSQSANRKLRNVIIIANACVWVAVIAAIRFLFF